MGDSRFRRTLFGRLLTVVGGILVLGLTAACGGGAASPTPTTAATAAAVPATPQRPALLSPVASPSSAPSTSAAVSKPTQAAEGSQTYTVQAGDTLGTIANHFYGDSTQWRRIYDANKDAIGDNPDALKLDTKLTIPPAAATPTPTG